MTYAVISDIHANLTALRAVMKDALSVGAEKIICLGDVVGYGPLPKETIALVRQTATVVLAGNHDDAVSGRMNADDFIDLAGEAVQRHRDTLDGKDLVWMRNLPYTCELDGILAAHGDFTNPPVFRYVETAEDAAANFRTVDAQLMFVGHTHVPTLFVTGASGDVYQLEPQDFALEDGKRYLVNPGSVGYPRMNRGVCLSTYVIYDSSARTIRFRQIPFSVASVMQRGTNTRFRQIILTLLAALTASAVLLGLLLWRSASRPTVKIVPVEIKATEDASLVLRQKSLTLPKGMKFVHPNLKLDKKRDPVNLQVVFKAADGTRLGEFNRTVSASYRRGIKIPTDSISAHLTVSRQSPSSQPAIISFEPTASVR